MGDYTKTPTPNLIRHAKTGIYYLRARFHGSGPIRRSLDTTKYETAKDKLDIAMAELKGVGKRVGNAPETLAQAVGLVKEAVASDPSLKARTRASYAEQLTALTTGKVALPTGEIRNVSGEALREWWQRTAKTYAPQRANHLLMWLRRALALARKLGAISRDPAEDLRPLKIPRTRLRLLTGEQFRALIADVRKKRNRHDSDQSGDWLEFMAYSGLRPAEVAALRWEDIDAKAGIVAVFGGIEGTKNRKARRVPMAPALIALVRQMQKRRTSEKVFNIKTPVFALRNACKRLGLPHQRLYDLRHTFATMCAQSGVDVPTIARWLGHSDGGTLALRTYVHPDEEHGLTQAKKVKF